MISAETSTWLVTRRHVDLGRTRSMICHHRLWSPAAGRGPETTEPSSLPAGHQTSRT